MADNQRKVTIRNGAIKKTVNVPDSVKTLGDLRGQLDRMGVSDTHTAYMTNGSESNAADNNQVIEDGMSFEFSQNTGQKG